MTSKERVRKAIRFEGPDRVPHFLPNGKKTETGDSYLFLVIILCCISASALFAQDAGKGRLYQHKDSYLESYKLSPQDYDYAMEIYNAPEPELVFPNPHPQAQWFPDAGLGLFMHWGIHSVEALQPSWSMIKDYPFAHYPEDDDPNKYIGFNYYHLAEKFNPESYNPDKWFKAAADAGFKYAVLTTKHHDGYALWPSKYGNMSTRTYMNGRDLIKEYVEACRKNGLKVGFYFSQRDWHFPDFPIYDVGFDNNRRGQEYEMSEEEAQLWAFSLTGQIAIYVFSEIPILMLIGKAGYDRDFLAHAADHVTRIMLDALKLPYPEGLSS